VTTPVPGTPQSRGGVTKMRRTSEDILRAASRLVTLSPVRQEDVSVRITVQDICSLAGCSPASFYKQFSGTDEVFDRLVDGIVEFVISLKLDEAIYSTRPTQAIIRDTCVAIIMQISKNRGIFAQSLNRRWIEQISSLLYSYVATAIQERGGTSLSPDSLLVKKMCFHHVSGAIVSVTTSTGVSSDKGGDELCRYLYDSIRGV